MLIDDGLTVTASGAFIGDVDQVAVMGKVAALSSVPGGVGLLTTAMLLDQTLRAISTLRPVQDPATQTSQVLATKHATNADRPDARIFWLQAGSGPTPRPRLQSDGGRHMVESR